MNRPRLACAGGIAALAVTLAACGSSTTSSPAISPSVVTASAASVPSSTSTSSGTPTASAPSSTATPPGTRSSFTTVPSPRVSAPSDPGAPRTAQLITATTTRPAAGFAEMHWQSAGMPARSSRTIEVHAYFGGCKGAPAAAWVQQNSDGVTLHLLDQVTHPSRDEACAAMMVMAPVRIVLPSPLGDRPLLGARPA